MKLLKNRGYTILRNFLVLTLTISLGGCVSLRKKAYASILDQGTPIKTKSVKIAENFYYVGTTNIAVFLWKTDDGLILFDTAYEHMHDLIVSNIDDAGFKAEDINFIFNTQAHMDHAGGIERMRFLSEATVMANPIARHELLKGSRGDFSSIIRLVPFTKVKTVDELDTEVITIGSTTLTGHHTPGHTKGCTSWSFQVNIQQEIKNVTILCGFKKSPIYKTRG